MRNHLMLRDRASALFGILLFAPAFVLIALAIRLDDGGPVLFLQERLGHRRKLFSIFKFRTMRDGQVTRVGRVLRQTGLDELPQFFNVLRGEIAVVGPRPLTQADVTRLRLDGAAFDFRWAVPPGITGMAQVYGARGLKFSLRMDRLYSRRRGLVVDAKLIALSFVINALGKRRVRRWLMPRIHWVPPPPRARQDAGLTPRVTVDNSTVKTEVVA